MSSINPKSEPVFFDDACDLRGTENQAKILGEIRGDRGESGNRYPVSVSALLSYVYAFSHYQPPCAFSHYQIQGMDS